jgi:hypothetical protein
MADRLSLELTRQTKIAAASDAATAAEYLTGSGGGKHGGQYGEAMVRAGRAGQAEGVAAAGHPRTKGRRLALVRHLRVLPVSKTRINCVQSTL